MPNNIEATPLKTPCYQIFFDSDTPKLGEIVDTLCRFGDLYLTSDSGTYLWLTCDDDTKFKKSLSKIDDEVYFRRIDVTEAYIENNHTAVTQWMIDEYNKYVRKIIESDQEQLRKVVDNIDKLLSEK